MRRSPSGGAANASATDRGTWAAAAFAAYLVLAVPVLVWAGSEYWFARGDDWGLIVRDAGSFDGLFRHQHQHWSTVPILSYKVVFAAVGLQSYLPYQLVTIAAHLTVAVLLRAIVRRAGGSPWVATVVAGSIVLYGSGAENMLLAVQVSMVTTMVCGLAQLLLLDHDGDLDRRDAFGVVVGIVGLMTSGVAPVFVVAVGIAGVLRRGWRVAAFHVVPLAVVYGAWNRWQSGSMPDTLTPPVDVLPEWVREGWVGVGLGLGQHPVVAVALVATAAAGLVLGCRDDGWSFVRGRAAVPLAMVSVASLLFVGVAWNRWFFGPESVRQDRYIGIGTVLVLPMVGVGVEAVRRRLPPRLAWVAFLPLLAGVPGNVVRLVDLKEERRPTYAGLEAIAVGMARSPLALEVDRDVRLEPQRDRSETPSVGWLLDHDRDGFLPAATPELTDRQEADIENRLSLLQREPTGVGCPAGSPSVTGPLDRGTVLRIAGTVSVRSRDGGDWSPAQRLDAQNGPEVVIQLPGRTFAVEAVGNGSSVARCTDPAT